MGKTLVEVHPGIDVPTAHLSVSIAGISAMNYLFASCKLLYQCADFCNNIRDGIVANVQKLGTILQGLSFRHLLVELDLCVMMDHNYI